MTTYLPSVKWPTLSKRSHSSSLQATDAQLHELPEHEAEALLQLQAATRGTIEASKPKLPECDPWVSLNDEQQSSMRDEILLRFLRYNALSVEKAQHQMETALKWRADFRVASLSTDVVHGAEVGIPITFLSTNKETDDALLLCLAESYVRREVNHAKQETGAAKLFDYMLYDVNGPRARRGSLVVDCTNLSYRNVDVVALKNGIFLYLNYFPDIFNKILIINYPKFMHGGKFCSFFVLTRGHVSYS